MSEKWWREALEWNEFHKMRKKWRERETRGRAPLLLRNLVEKGLDMTEEWEKEAPGGDVKPCCVPGDDSNEQEMQRQLMEVMNKHDRQNACPIQPAACILPLLLLASHCMHTTLKVHPPQFYRLEDFSDQDQHFAGKPSWQSCFCIAVKIVAFGRHSFLTCTILHNSSPKVSWVATKMKGGQSNWAFLKWLQSSVVCELKCP